MLPAKKPGAIRALAIFATGVSLLLTLYIFSQFDRVNAGFASLTMNRDLGISATAYGLGAGLFFITYFIFEVPSNLALEKFGARRWIAVPGLSSVQPSEFVKPSLAVISAWLLAQARAERRMPGYFLSTLLVGTVLALLVMQPDLGMSIVVAAVWAAQLFVVGLPMWIAGAGVIGGAGALVGILTTTDLLRALYAVQLWIERRLGGR